MNGIDPGAFGAIGLLMTAVLALFFVLYFVPVPLWIAAWSSGAYVGLLHADRHAAAARAAGDHRQRPHQRGEGRAGASRSTTSKRTIWPAATSCGWSTP